VLSEGTRGPLTQAYREWQGIGSENPQIFALGVKELWETKQPLDRVVHTLGWPLPRDAFGGSFMYPLEPNLVALGLVVGLDYRETTLDVHELLQRMKLHPFFRPTWRAARWWSGAPRRSPRAATTRCRSACTATGVLIVGDARASWTSPRSRASTTRCSPGSTPRAPSSRRSSGGRRPAARSPRTTGWCTAATSRRPVPTRNMRLAFKDGFFVGGAKAGLMTLTGGRFPGGKIAWSGRRSARDGDAGAPFVPDGKLTFSKVDAVFKAGNQTRDDIPSHLIVGEDVPAEVAELYEHMCPAGVYERRATGWW
jgi:electron-transferring-flavoprotein dehydrogenase